MHTHQQLPAHLQPLAAALSGIRISQSCAGTAHPTSSVLDQLGQSCSISSTRSSSASISMWLEGSQNSGQVPSRRCGHMPCRVNSYLHGLRVGWGVGWLCHCWPGLGWPHTPHLASRGDSRNLLAGSLQPSYQSRYPLASLLLLSLHSLLGRAVCAGVVIAKGRRPLSVCGGMVQAQGEGQQGQNPKNHVRSPCPDECMHPPDEEEEVKVTLPCAALFELAAAPAFCCTCQQGQEQHHKTHNVPSSPHGSACSAQ